MNIEENKEEKLVQRDETAEGAISEQAKGEGEGASQAEGSKEEEEEGEDEEEDEEEDPDAALFSHQITKKESTSTS